MKKFFSGLLAIVTALALASCAGYGNGDSGSSSSSGSSGTPSYLRFDDLGFDPVTATSSNENVVKASVEDEARAAGGSKVVKLISVGAGTANVKITGADSTSIDIIVVVGSDLRLTWSKKTGGGDTEYVWNFQATALTTDLAWVPGSGNTSGTTGTELLKVKLEADGTYESTPAGLTMKLSKDGEFNKVSPAATLSSTVTPEGATAGHVEPAANNTLKVSVKGPFTATMVCAGNSSNDKTDRYAYIKIGSEEVAAPNKATNILPAAGQTITYTYTGTDTVTVEFGGTSITRIHTVSIKTANGDGTGKTAGEVKTLGSFSSQTDDSTANDEATLGIVGTSVESKDSSIATAEIVDGKIKVTSVAGGKTEIYVKDGDKKATIPVTVSGTGAITIGTITKYSEPSAATTVTYDLAALSAESPIKDIIGTQNKGKSGQSDDSKNEHTGVAISSASITPDADVTIPDATSNTSLVLTAAGTGVGNSKASGSNYVTYKTASAVFVKRDGIKVTGIKGNVKVTVSWIMGSAKAAGNRKLEVTALSTGETVETPCNDAKGAQTDCVITANFGEGGDLFIGASDEAGVTKIKIEPAN